MKCCFCINRRIGCYLFAFVVLLSCFNEITTCSVDLKNGKGRYCFLAAATSKGKELTSSMKAMHVLVVILSIPMLVVTIIFIVGLIMESQKLVLMFIIAFIVYLILAIIIVIVVSSLAAGQMADKMFWYIYTISGVLLGVYWIIVVIDEYRNMSES